MSVTIQNVQNAVIFNSKIMEAMSYGVIVRDGQLVTLGGQSPVQDLKMRIEFIEQNFARLQAHFGKANPGLVKSELKDLKDMLVRSKPEDDDEDDNYCNCQRCTARKEAESEATKTGSSMQGILNVLGQALGGVLSEAISKTSERAAERKEAPVKSGTVISDDEAEAKAIHSALSQILGEGAVSEIKVHRVKSEAEAVALMKSLAKSTAELEQLVEEDKQPTSGPNIKELAALHQILTEAGYIKA